MTTRPTDTRRGDAGFSLLEIMVSMTIMLLIMGGTFAAMTSAMRAEKATRNIVTLNSNLRSAMDLMVRDMLQVGQGLPVGRVIGIPNGAGSTRIVRPGPDADGGCAGTDLFPDAPTISAVTVGPDLGPRLNGACTDVITTLAHDGAFDNVNVSSIAANGRSLTVYPWGADADDNTDDDLDIADAPDVAGDNVRVGDLLEVSKGSTSVLVAVTAVAGRRITFEPGDPLGINQFDVPTGVQGTMNRLKAQDPIDEDDEVVDAGVVQEGQSRVSRVRMITYWIDTTTDPASPRLVRQVNAGPINAVAFDIHAFRLTYDIANGLPNPPANVRMTNADMTLASAACAPQVCSPNQIRKANVTLAIRSGESAAEAGYYQNALYTQVALRSLAFVDKYR
jgi:prepilin-type N-terminal cleavage/methylation domain-containing protein